jgi:16S rRNA (cytidine1402-2'-O)-methyltransferase
VVAREITKLHEEFVRGTLSQLAETFTDKNRARGEIVLLIAAAREADQQTNTQSVSNALAERLALLQQDGLDEKAALKKAARGLGLKRDEAYRLMMAQKNRRSR